MAPATCCCCADSASQAMPDMEPTIFPASEIKEEIQTMISSYSSRLGHDFNQDLTKPCNMFCMAWAVLLERFTGLDNVCFGFRSEHMVTAGSERTGGVVSAMQVHVTADHSVQENLDENAFVSVMIPETKAETLFNTTLSICNLDKQPLCEDEARKIDSCCKLHMSVDPATMKTLLSWDSTFMTREQAETISNTYDKIFREISSQKRTTVSAIHCCSEQDELKILSWNGSPLNNVQKCIHQAVSWQGAMRPDSEAVCSWDGSFSYAQLLSLSDRLAFQLKKLGVGAETFVPICFDKSKWTIVAMLAILKAGGIFVPLDPTQPLLRLQNLTRKVDADTILCSPQHQEMIESIASKVIPVDAQLFESLAEQRGEVDCGLWSSGAYMIFTSGTTGEPKGALIQHGALLSSALAHGPAMMMDNNTRSLHFAASTFDVSITEILTCLILGGCVCIPSEEARLNAIEEAITQLRVNWALLTPTFVKFINPDNVPSLKTLVTGGEAMTQAVIRSWSHINLINCYGPAETSVVSHVHRGMREGKNPLNIGHQVGIHCWVVDRYNHNRLMPVGAVGELVIEGHTLAREYYKEPEKTSEAFIVDPEWALNQSHHDSPRRMYKTGDLVRYNNDGSFHIAGRKDAQIKFHGQRIELGEIEYHINVGTSIKHGMVVLPKAGFCEGRLLAIVQLSDSLGHDLVPNGQPYELINGPLEQVAVAKVEETKQLLTERLPSYMVPSMWLAVEFIPRLQSGKLDRKRTGKWVEDMSEAIYRKLNPVAVGSLLESLTFSNDTESQLHNIWTHVLNLKPEQLGLSQSFLSVGGDSISAMQVMSECKKRGLGLTVSNIISCKSISALARHVKEIEKPLLLQETTETPFELSPIQRLYFSRSNHDQGHYNQSFLLRVSRRIDESAMRRAIEVVIRKHSMLRARFSQDAGGKWQQRVTDKVESSYRLRSVQLSSNEQLSHALIDSQTCLDYANGPLLAADLLDEEGQDQRLFVVAHHLVIDLVSWRIVLQELEELLLRPELKPDMDRPLPFQTWCQMQREHASAQTPEQALPIHGIPDGDPAYWGMENTPNVYGQMVHEGFEVGSAQTSLLLSKCHDALRTEIPDVLMAAMVYSFGQTFTDRQTPAIFAEGHGRESWDPSIDLSNVVGWFTTIYPVFAGSDATSTLIDTIKMVKDGRRKVPDNGRPYFASRWLTQSGEEAFSRHWPLEITFNYLGQYQQLEREGALFIPVKGIAGEVSSATDGADVGSLATCISLFEVSAVITKGTLRFSFLFNQNMKHQPKIREWIASCEHNLGLLLESLAVMSPEPTLSDFPLVSLTYDRLRLLTQEKLPEIGIEDMGRVEDIYPCSPMQSGLLVSTTKDSAAYAAYTLHQVKSRSGGTVDVMKLADAWKRVVDYHPMLRTVFVESVTLDESLFDQVLLKEVQVPLVISELETDEEVIRTLDKARHHDEYSQLLHVFEICKTTSGNVFCKLDISHVIMDGTSLSILFRDLSLAYAGILGPDKGPPYSEYIRSLQHQGLQHGIEYWKSYLMGIEPCHFPVLDDGEVVETRESKCFRVEFDELAQLQRLCDDRGVTIVNAIYAAWALVLRLYTASEEVCFGYLTSARDSQIEGIEDVVGPVINMVTCRANISDSTTLGNTMTVVQNDFLNSLEHRHIPLAQVQHALKLSDVALFNTALSYRKLPPAPQDAPDVVFEEVRPTYDPDEYDVSINIEAGENDMMIDLTYWSDTMSDGQATNVASAFTTALSNILHHSDKPVAQLNHLGPQHHRQISQWNNTIPEAVESCVHGLFEEQAVLRPEAPAITSWEIDFTYAELDTASTRLAHYLADLGVSLEQFVLVCFDKSAFAIVAMLAVLKAGGVCVPLDPAHPDAAIRLRAEDTGASIAVVSSSMASRLSNIVEKTVVVDSHLLQTISENATLPQINPHNACFVIYTSGSTGRPKGVVLEHRGIATNAKSSGPKLGYGEESRVLQFASYTFDNSLAEIFTTLALGGCVCVPSEHERFNDMAGAISRYRVTLADITPTVACLINPLDVPTLKTLALGGEAVTHKCVDIWRDFVSLQCCYGPSECSVNSTYSGEIAQPGKATNIGRAVGSVTWVVDATDHNRLLPIGCIGELLIDGPIVSRGYLNLPEKMAQSFVAPPSSLGDMCREGNLSRKLYKTGDLVRYNSDGTLTYFGRKDTQVKLHGQRIELEEIEHHLEQNLPQDWTSAVELIQFEGKKSLASFICADLGAVRSASNEKNTVLAMDDSFRSLAKELEIALSNNLPAYMIPSVWFPVSEMPMTSSGKLDRRSLRSMVQSLPASEMTSYKLALKSGRAPTSDMEKQLASMWAHVLNVDVNTIGVEDHFFRLGGDSIAAMQLVTLARKSNINLTVTGVFQKVSLLDMAQSALPLSRAAVTAVHPFSLLPEVVSLDALKEEIGSCAGIQVGDVEDIYPCTPLQQGLMALSAKEPGAYVAQLVFRLPNGTDLDNFKMAWRLVIEAEGTLRTRLVQTTDHGILNVVVKGDVPQWSTSRSLSDLQRLRSRLPSHNGGRLTDYAIVEDGSDVSFVWTIHHALYDGWCLPLILDKVKQCYESIQPSTIPEPIASGPAYSRFIRHLTETDPSQDIKFWESYLSDISTQHFPRLPDPDYKSSASGLIIHKTGFDHSRDSLKSAGLGITTATMIRSAWALAVSTYAASDDVVFWETMTGRDAPVDGIEEMIGATLATVPTRIALDRSQKVSDLLSSVQAQSAVVRMHQFAGIHRIKRINTDTAFACGAQNLLAINYGPRESTDSFWCDQTNEMAGTNFYSYPLMLSCHVADGKLETVVHFDPEVICESQMHRVMDQFALMLTAVTSKELTDEKLSDLELISTRDYQSLSEMNGQMVPPCDMRVHDVIKASGIAQPSDKLSVCAWDQNLTYEDLDSQSTHLSSVLIEAGVRPNTFVPFCMEKSSMVVVSILAILKSGAAFVPLDYAHPDARISGIITDVEAEFVLSSPQYTERLTKLIPKVISVSKDTIQDSMQLQQHDLSVPTKSPAYCIFTSGTTGRPKGTIIDHSAFCTGALAHGKAMGMNESSRVLQFASHTFDASIMETLSTLIHGGTVCVPSEEERSHDIAGFIRRMSVNWALLTPSVAQLIEPSTVPELKTLVLGGEAMSRAHVRTWASSVQLMNAYGPSETSVVATVNSSVTLDSSPANIGRAVGGLCWVVDSTNVDRLLPIGVVGELLVEGPILSQGYLKNPQKNAESFITNPRWCSKFTSETASSERRFYRTGDLVKISKDGSIEFQGRKDNQVKINGQRLELSEIEHHLNTDAIVQACLAFIPTAGPLKSRLVAVLSLHSTFVARGPDEMQLVIDFARSELTSVRDSLTGQLAAYMIPSTWIVVNRIPLLPSGKLDRRRVANWVEAMSPEQYQLAIGAQDESHASGLDREATDIETKLRAAWAKVLGIEADSVPFTRSFIQLGGDSISAMQLVATCRSSNMALSVSQIMQSKSIVKLASFVQAVEDVTQDDEQEDKAFPLSPIQKLYFESMYSGSTHFNQSMVLETTRKITPGDLSSALEAIVKTHSMLRARFSDVDGAYSQRITSDIAGSYVFESHVGMDQCRVSEVIEKTQKSLNIFQGPLLAAASIEMEDTDKQIVFLAAHHLVVDVVSWNIILQDLEGLLSLSVSNLAKPLSFQTWNMMQLQEARNQTPDRVFHNLPTPAQDLAYWGMQAVPNIHGDVMTETIEIASDVSLQLLGSCHEAFNTNIVDVLLASLLSSFHEAFPDRLSMPTIFNEGHGREPTDNKLDLSLTVGWFTTLCPVYLPELLPAQPDILDIICWVRDFRRRIPGNGRPYFAHQMLSEACQTESTEWPVELAFNYLGQRQKTESEGSLFQSLDGVLASVGSETDIGVDVPRLALIEISASFGRNGLSFSFSYNRQMKYQPAIKEWVNNFSVTLQTAVERMSQAKAEPQDLDFSLLPLAFRAASKVDMRLAELGISCRADVEAVYPCSPVQMGILFAQIRNPEFYSYSVTFGVNCIEPSHTVDVQRLRDAWQRVVQRHSTLRTTFVDGLLEEGGINQVVLRNHCAEVSFFECADNDELQMITGRITPKIMSNKPPHHLSIFSGAQGKVTCVLEMSHALSDGTSMPILFRDLAMAYEGSLDPTIVSAYRDYVSYLQCQGSHDIDYWREYLTGAEPCHLPSASRSTEPKVLGYLDQTISCAADLQAFCTGAGVTLSNVLQLAWALVLQAYTGHDDVCFGYLLADRDAPVDNIDNAIGVFINMLVLRVRLGSSQSVGDALGAVQQDLSAAIGHKNISLTDIQRVTGLLNEPLFNTAYSFQRRSISKSMANGSLSFDVREAQDPNEYDLTVNVEVWDQAAELQLCYWTDKISDSQAKSIASTFDKILTSITSCDLSLPTNQLDIVSDDCAQQLMRWNNTEPALLDQCVHNVFERNVQSLPNDTPAIEAWDARFTYSEVDVLSSRLAHRLLSLGILPEMYVPLCFEKSAWTPIAMLAVLKAGAAFVPIDPSHPPERIEFLVQNTSAKLILCSTSLADKFDIGVPFLAVGHETMSPLSALPAASPSILVQPSHPAYIIFTSGTTGLPKGTVVEHAAFTTGGTAHAAAIKMTCSSRVLQFASYTFDASIMEILTTFLVGGCVCVPSDEERMNDLAGAMAKYDVNWALLTPSVAKVLKPGSVPGLKVLVTGGEAMSTDHITKWLGHAALINAYGPSEASVIAASHTKVDENGAILNEEPANIGHAVGCRTWVVDPHNHNHLMPIGSIGELLLEGPILARGYLKNETKTTDAFIDYPPWRANMSLSGDRVDRMYKTGDLVSQNSDGSLNYVSRKDTQIKLNGQRIELGEIEHHVRANLPAHVQSAVELVVPQSKTSTKTLAAFFTVDDHEVLKETSDPLLPMSSAYMEIGQSLKTAIRVALPTHMVPTMYVPVTKMPWTSAGKLDRQKLKAIVQSVAPQDIGGYKLVGASNSRAPTTMMQRKLQKIWAGILNIHPSAISIDDSFFRLGGDSISAMKVVSAARMEEISLTVMDILTSPTLSEMATCCSHSENTTVMEVEPFSLLHDADSPSSLLDEVADCCDVPTSQIQDLYPCSSLQEGLVAASMQQPGAYVARYIFKVPSIIDMERLKMAWQSTSNHVDILRSRIVNARSLKTYQAILEPHAINWKHYSSLEAIADKTIQLPERNGGVLAKYAIIDSSDPDLRYFVWSVHHALYDAWSMPSLLNLVSQFYHEATAQLAPPVPYANFARYLVDSDAQASDEFWKATFQNASGVSHFPTATPSDEESTYSSLQHTIQCRRDDFGADITIPTIVRAAWALLLGAHTGADDVGFGETLSGRDIALEHVEDILGPTLTTVPWRVQIDRSATVGHFLQSLHKKSAEVIPHQHAGLQHIKRLGGSIAVASDFRNLLVIQASDEAIDHQDLLQPLEENGDHKNFFTYPLVVECAIELNNLVLTIHHNETVMTSWQVERLAHQFDTLVNQLSRLSQEPDRKVAELQFCSAEDLQMIEGWNHGTCDAVRDTIPSLFWQSVAKHHDATSIRAWDGHLTYDSLAQHAGRLAKRLVQEGVRAETMVPCCMDKSLWTTVAMLAVVLAGGTIIPLDPAHPRARHAEIARECKASIALCSPEYQDRFVGVVPTVIAIDQALFNEHLCQDHVASEDLPLVADKDAAFVIYTSGSTGKAKGVVIEHGSFVASSRAYTKHMHLSVNSSVFHFTSYAFDIAMGETFGALTNGACLCVPSEEMRVADLPGAMNTLGATWAFLTPSLANMQDPSMFKTLQTLVCGGEAMTSETVSKWSNKVKLINGYGPAECTVFALANSNVSEDQDHSNIGRAMDGCQTWIVDTRDHNKLVPVGCEGELIISGPILSRGYLNDSAKTSQSFIEDPAWIHHFDDKNHQKPVRLYKTGDLVRYRPDGNLTFIGRKDNQVKLHGQRMELGEIEACLESDPRLRNALVALPKSGVFKGRLVAVLSFKDSDSHNPGLVSSQFSPISESAMKVARLHLADLQHILSENLPPYMMPSSWLVVEAIPLLLSGKLDRASTQKWLTEMAAETPEFLLDQQLSQDAGATDTTFVGQLLRKIWASVLRIPDESKLSGRSFISLGGDSIMAMQVMSRCRDHSIQLTMRDIMSGKSISDLVTLIEKEGRGKQTVNPEYEDDNTQPFALSPIQQLFFNNSSNKDRGDRFNQSQLFSIKESVNKDTFTNAIHALVQRHPMLRARFNKSSTTGQWSQQIAPDTQDSYGLHFHDVSDASQIAHSIATSQNNIDISGPVFIVDLFRMPNGLHHVSLIAHHLVVDVVSWINIAQDLETLLSSSPSMPSKPLTFRKWNAAQIEHATSMAKNSEDLLPFTVRPANLDYWGVSDASNNYSQVTQQSFSLSDTDIISLLLGDAHQALRTEPLDLFISALLISFGQCFPDRQLPTLFNEGHGREPWDDSIDLSQTVGWFTSLCPIDVSHNNVDPTDTIDYVRKAKDVRRAIPGNGRPYFAQRYLTDSGKQCIDSHEPMEILLNFLGRSQQSGEDDSILRLSNLSMSDEDMASISDVGPETRRLALFELSISILDEGIQFTFMYNKNMLHQDLIQQWVTTCKEVLNNMAMELSTAPSCPTISDFPLMSLDYAELGKLATKSLPAAHVRFDEVEDMYPCSPMQMGILLSQLLDPSQYLFYAVLEVSAPSGSAIDAAKLAQACSEVVERHAALRTVFIESVRSGGSFDQVVLRPGKPRIATFKCREIDVMAKLNTRSLGKANKRHGVPILPYQVTICETPQGKVFIKLEMNHAVTDGASTAIVLRDISSAYANSLPSGAPSYKEYINYITKQPSDSSLMYWKSYLSGARHTEFPALNSDHIAGRSLGSIAVEFDRFSELQSLGLVAGVTFSNMIMVAWALVLRKYTNSQDVCFGYLASGRDADIDGVDEIVGPLINMLVFRFQFTHGMLLKRLFLDTQEDYANSLPHQHFSLARVSHELGQSKRGFFNTAVSIQNAGASSDADFSALKFESVDAFDPSEYAVTLNANTTRGDEGIVFRYWTNILSHSQAKELAIVMSEVLSDMIDHSEEALSHLRVSQDSSLPTNPAQDLHGWTFEHSDTSEQFKTTNSTISSYSTGPGATLFSPATSWGSLPRDKDQVYNKLSTLWKQHLDVATTDLTYDGSFFEYGGDSIIAMAMVGDARDQDLPLTVADIFKNPSFGTLLNCLRDKSYRDGDMVSSDGNISLSGSKKEGVVMDEHTYEPLSLLPQQNAEQFVREHVCPVVGVSRASITDVLPTTDFQAQAVEGSLLDSRWMLNYFYLDGEGPLDVALLQESITNVIASYDILRTVFVPYQATYLQVILRHVQSELVFHDVDDVEQFTLDLESDHLRQVPSPEKPSLRFILARHEPSERHRLFIRLSHALYDGVCFPTILNALKASYEGEPIATSPSYATYIHGLFSKANPDQHTYWRSLLEGSAPTNLIPRQCRSMRTNPTEVLRKIVATPSLATVNITTATVIKAAWSVVLAKNTGTRDVVFGHLISGRNSRHVPGIEAIVGPCLNVVPVRVQYQDSWTVLDLLQHIQHQQVDNIPHESLGFREIIRSCTNWDDDGANGFSTVVQHQSMAQTGSLDIGDNTYEVGVIASQEDTADFSVVTTPQDSSSTEVCFLYREGGVERTEFAEKLFDCLCSAIGELSTDVKTPLVSLM